VSADVYSHTLSNGMVLLAERMDYVRSAALNFLVPAGCAYDPPKHLGIASVLSDLITRGAGSRDSRELSLALDNLGLDRDESVGPLHVRFWGATLARNLAAALDIYSDILRRPHLSDDELEPVQALALQDLQSLEDEPRHKLMIELRRRHYPAPLGHDRRGTREGIEGLTPALVRGHYRRLFQPRGTILSVAGNIQWEPLRDQVEKLFGDWRQGEDPHLSLTPQPTQVEHLQKDTTQTQIGIAYPSVPIGNADYYAAQGAVHVLSGGMSSRLFTEVREKRGLCYAVWASYQLVKDRASVICYAGTTNERAQDTLDVTFGELHRLKDGIETEEVDRVKAGLKSSLIMQEESTSARAGTLASDWYYLGRVRSFDEIQSAIDGLTPQGIVEHLHRCPPANFTVVTLGPKPEQPCRPVCRPWLLCPYRVAR
jgi:predicted Zn-dependent peptidase